MATSVHSKVAEVLPSVVQSIIPREAAVPSPCRGPVEQCAAGSHPSAGWPHLISGTAASLGHPQLFRTCSVAKCIYSTLKIKRGWYRIEARRRYHCIALRFVFNVNLQSRTDA